MILYIQRRTPSGVRTYEKGNHVDIQQWNPTDVVLVLGFAVVILALTMVMVMLSRPRRVDITADPRFQAKVQEVIEQVAGGASQAANITTVLEIIADIDRVPQLPEKLATYSETVVQAALIHTLNCLGKDVDRLNKQISNARSNYNDQVAGSREAQRDKVLAQMKTLEGVIAQRAGVS